MKIVVLMYVFGDHRTDTYVVGDFPDPAAAQDWCDRHNVIDRRATPVVMFGTDDEIPVFPK